MYEENFQTLVNKYATDKEPWETARNVYSDVVFLQELVVRMSKSNYDFIVYPAARGWIYDRLVQDIFRCNYNQNDKGYRIALQFIDVSRVLVDKLYEAVMAKQSDNSKLYYDDYLILKDCLQFYFGLNLHDYIPNLIGSSYGIGKVEEYIREQEEQNS